AGGGEVRRLGVVPEEPGRDHVHALIGTLRRQNRRDEQLVRIPEVEGALRVRVLGVQPPDDLGRARALRRQALPPRHALRPRQPPWRLLLRTGGGALLQCHHFPFRAKNARTSSSSHVFTTSLASSQPLRAMVVPSRTLSSSRTECASGLSAVTTPFALAAGQ